MVQAAIRALACAAWLHALAPAQDWCSPEALAASKDGATLYVGCATGQRVEVLDTARREVIRRIAMPGPVTGLALSPDGKRLYVTCAGPRGGVEAIQLNPGTAGTIPAGHTAMAPVLSPDGALLYVCNRFNNDISVIDTAARRELSRIRVTREPVSAALSPDGKVLLVANALPAGRADVPFVAAEISVLSAAERELAGRIPLPNGSTGVRGIRISPDGALACVTHQLARYYLPTTQVERGWTQTNAASILDVPGRKLLATVLLDEIDRGAANPWAVEWNADGRRLAITHAGTHELSVIDVAALRAKLASAPRDPADDLSFLVGVRRRVPLAGNGPRAMAVAGCRAWVAGFFSDTVEMVDLAASEPAAAVVARLSRAPLTIARRGEMLFNDGTLSFQGWLSCASCHGPEARVDGLNWDLLNDGIGNPKNVKSLLLAHRTPPSMSQGVRENAEAAVRAGIRYILFAERPEQDARAIDEFLKALEPLPSPYLVDGKLSPAALRGEKIFRDPRVGCATCHPPGLFTDLRSYDVGTRAKTDTVSVFDTPALVEAWRTAPYFHDGSAATLRDVLTEGHGGAAHLSTREKDDLVAYLLSL